MATRYEHAGAAVPTTLSADYDPADPTISITSATGWPTGAVGPFVVCIGAGTASEHKLLIASRAGTVLTVSDSTFDDTADVAHLSGAAIVHSFSAKEADEANDLASDLTALGGTPVTTSASQTLTNKSVALGDNTVTGTKAQFNAAMTDADFATVAGTETLTNKTLTAPAMTAPDATGDLSGFGEAWTAFTPTLTNFTGTVNLARYHQIGKRVRVQIKITLDAAPTAGAMTLSLPVNPYDPSQVHYIGTAVCYDTGSLAPYLGVVILDAANDRIQFTGHGNTNLWTTAVPNTWASGDTLHVDFEYEAA